jgi:hypothetical protein
MESTRVPPHRLPLEAVRGVREGPLLGTELARPRIAMKFGHAIPILRVSDFDRSIAYYVDRLGWNGDSDASAP